MKTPAIGIAVVLSFVGVVAVAWSLPYWRLQTVMILMYIAVRGMGWLARESQKESEER